MTLLQPSKGKEVQALFSKGKEVQIRVSLTTRDKANLDSMAEADVRSLSHMIRWLIREETKRRRK